MDDAFGVFCFLAGLGVPLAILGALGEAVFGRRIRDLQLSVKALEERLAQAERRLASMSPDPTERRLAGEASPKTLPAPSPPVVAPPPRVADPVPVPVVVAPPVPLAARVPPPPPPVETVPEPAVAPAPVAARVEDPMWATASAPVSAVAARPTPAPPVLPRPEPSPVAPPPEPPVPASPTLEQRLAANWMGIAGSLAIVLGVGFLSVWATLRVGPFGRFLMADVFAVALLGASFLIGRMPWGTGLSRWTRSASAAVFLMGCVASVVFTPMRSGIESTAAGLLLVSAGVVANLGLGFATGGQVFAALHVVLSLLALGLVPPGTAPLVLGAVVASAGVGASVRNARWEANLGVTAVAWTVFHVAWFLRGSAGMPFAEAHAIPVACNLVVLGGALAVHYLHADRDEPDTIALVAHVGTWALLALDLVLHRQQPWTSSLALAAASIVTHRTSELARAGGPRWLFVTDRLVSLATGTAAMLVLGQGEVGWLDVFLLATLPPLAFLATESRRPEPVLVPVAAGLVQGMTIAVLAQVGLRHLRGDMGELHEVRVLLGLAVLVAAALPWVEARARRHGHGFGNGGSWTTGVGWTVAAATGVASLVLLRPEPGRPLLVAAVMAALLGWRVLARDRVLAVAALVAAAVVTVALGIDVTWPGRAGASAALVALLVPVLAVLAESASTGRRGRVEAAGLVAGSAVLVGGVVLDHGPGMALVAAVATGAGLVAAVRALAGTEAGEDDGALNEGTLLETALGALAGATSYLLVARGSMLAVGGVGGLLAVLVRYRRAMRPGTVELASMVAVVLVAVDAAGAIALRPVGGTTLLLSLLVAGGAAALALTGPGEGDEPAASPAHAGVAWLATMALSWWFAVEALPLLPGLLWLGVAVGGRALSRRLPALGRPQTADALGWMAITSLAAFAVREVLVEVPQPALGTVSLQGALVLAGAGVAAWWALTADEAREPPAAWLLELSTALVLVVVVRDLPSGLWAPATMAVAFGLVEAGRLLPKHVRLAGLGVAVGWLAVGWVGLVSEIGAPSGDPLLPLWVQGPATLLGAVAFFFRVRDVGPALRDEPQWEGVLTDLARRYPVRALLWPVFGVAALLLRATFDATMLTVTWGALSLVMFATALLLRERATRRTSLVALAAVLVRLVLVDLQGSDVFVKAIAFIGTGLVLLAASSLASRFEDRLGAGPEG